MVWRVSVYLANNDCKARGLILKYINQSSYWSKRIIFIIYQNTFLGRVYEVSLADLQAETDAERSFRKFKLICEDVQGKNCLTNFYGMNLTTDKLRSMVKKWQTLIEAFVDVKTTDGYLVRVFCIGFTLKQNQTTQKTCYAQSQQVWIFLCPILKIIKCWRKTILM